MQLVGLFMPTFLHAEAVFHIECPPDVTVDCDAEIWDLSIYGTAYVYGYGDPQPAGPPISTEYNLNSCGVGTIVRTWVAYDYSGTPYYCSQVITVAAGGYGSIDIHWPYDYTIHSCDPQVDPEDLPPGYDYPTIDGGGASCTQILYSHDDLVFNINPPACIKVLRKWTVIDWCSYDPNHWPPQGIWEHTQIIKIKPENPPMIWCPGDTLVSAGADCTAGYVQLPAAFGSSDCGADVQITNNSPYAFSNGADASGHYPLGTTTVTFWADDGCGQETSCSMQITVKDLKKPTPICFGGISLGLMMMPDGYYMGLRADMFDKGSFDNCTPKDKLKMWVEPSVVDCDDLGPTEVRVYVEDESGNVQYCNTIVYVQDNMGICPPDDGVIDGTVQTSTGHLLEEVQVDLIGADDYEMTDSNGTYHFTSVPFGHAYVVSPGISSDTPDGITVLDLSTMLKHILGVERFTSPYQHIAGDMDHSGRVSANDLVMLRNLIFQDLSGLKPATTWRFIDANFNFPDSPDPILAGFPESYQISTLTDDMAAIDFIGVKLGDINGDGANLTGGQHILSRSEPLSISLPDLHFDKGDEFSISVLFDDFDAIDAMEFGLEFSKDALKVISVSSATPGYGLDIMDEADEKGVISTLWYGVEAPGSPRIYTMQVRALRDGRTTQAIELADAQRSMAYKSGIADPVPLRLEFVDPAEISTGLVHNLAAMQVGQNYPNPFSEETTIPVELPSATELQISLFDMSGRLLWSDELDGVEGWQEIRIQSPLLAGNGLVLCRVTSEFGSATVRMLANE